MSKNYFFTFTKPKPFSEQYDVNEVIPYTLGKEKAAFDGFMILTIGIALAFLLGGFFAYKIIDIVAQQELKIEQLKKTIQSLKTPR